MDFLQQFEKRMEFIAVVDSIVNRRNTSPEIENLLSKVEIDNLLLSVLVFIMEVTLTEDQECTIDSIAEFLKEILPFYEKQLATSDIETLTRYLIKDILQNKSQIRAYTVMDYDKGAQRNIPVRLIRDKETDEGLVVYELTSQGYNFMFRTKEIDEELGFELETVKLNLLIKKKNYRKAVAQSLELIRMLQSKRRDLQQFEDNLRNNIASVSGLDYDNMIVEINNMLQQEYESMIEINNMINLAKQRLLEEEENQGRSDEKIRQAKKDVIQISKNVERALKYQRRLLVESKAMKSLYLDQLEDSIAYTKIKVYDFEKMILRPLEMLASGSSRSSVNITNKLLRPLFIPEPQRTLNLKTVYDEQSQVREIDEEGQGVEQEEVEEDNQPLINEGRNRNHTRIIKQMIKFASAHPDGFAFSQFFETLKADPHFHDMVANRMLYLVMLKLFEEGEVDINLWLEDENNVVHEANGEFDLAYCLSAVLVQKEHYYDVGRIRIEKTDEEFSHIQVFDQKSGYEERITMNDFRFEVEMNESRITNL
ncbi:hypothetical protein GH810_09880 [Acetobacterium paludosum]|uniref:Uncharacterized protein n=1 Tax=Acetobacterium paludosum TaxID=52693 RepID=A0A923HVW8_9FIRM|nr:hypothetical protein [Acetobacterium paludosum]MBC3888617.1 hypothetical protein [Acetobacterium paludosum]